MQGLVSNPPPYSSGNPNIARRAFNIDYGPSHQHSTTDPHDDTPITTFLQYVKSICIFIPWLLVFVLGTVLEMLQKLHARASVAFYRQRRSLDESFLVDGNAESSVFTSHHLHYCAIVEFGNPEIHSVVPSQYGTSLMNLALSFMRQLYPTSTRAGPGDINNDVVKAELIEKSYSGGHRGKQLCRCFDRCKLASAFASKLCDSRCGQLKSLAVGSHIKRLHKIGSVARCIQYTYHVNPQKTNDLLDHSRYHCLKLRLEEHAVTSYDWRSQRSMHNEQFCARR